MSVDWLDRLRLDPGTRTLGELIQERQWAAEEIARLRAGRKVGGPAAAAGWGVDDIPHTCSFFFCALENERVCVSIECFEPGAASSPGWPTRP